MTPDLNTPGVYVEEVPSGTRTIEGVPTSVAAFVGRALRGPVDEAVPVRSGADVERTFGPLGADSALGYAVRAFFANGGVSAVVVRVDDGSATARVDLGGDLVVEASGPGSWANGMVVGISHPAPAEATAVAAAQGLADGGSVFTLWVTCGGETEVHAHVTSAAGPRQVDTVLESSMLARLRTPLPVPLPRPPAGSYAVTSAGQDGAEPAAEAYISASGTTRGIRALDAVDAVTLLVLPPVTPAGQVPDEVWAHALAYALERRAFVVVDPPPGLPGVDVADWAQSVGLTGPAAASAAVYYPRLDQLDPRSGTVGSFAASGSVAGVYARTDLSRGVWKAPAGIEATVSGVVRPSLSLTDAEQGALNTRAVNAIRSFPNRGTVLWGSRTLRGADGVADDFRYVPVRRLALHIEESLRRGTRWAVFEPNDEPLWAQLRLAVGDFLHELFRAGAFQGATARQAYFVKCDAETTSRSDIAAGVLGFMVGFAPLKPAEFVTLHIRQRAALPGE